METLKSMIKESRRTVPVGAIRNGTVIDHITAGVGIRLVRLLRLEEQTYCFTVGVRLPSKRMQMKDLIKVEGWEISRQLAEHIAVFSPSTTISLIRDFQVAEKFPVELPKCLSGIIKCPNPSCITNHESARTEFAIEVCGKKTTLRCQHCEKVFSQNEIYPLQLEASQR